MKTVFEWIREHIMLSVYPEKVPDLDELMETEWSSEFELYMRNRLILGRFRYGAFGDTNKPQWDRISDVKRRCDLYNQTSNLEHLVDIANLAMLEFVEGTHKNREWIPTDDDIHTEVVDRSRMKKIVGFFLVLFCIIGALVAPEGQRVSFHLMCSVAIGFTIGSL